MAPQVVVILTHRISMPLHRKLRLISIGRGGRTYPRASALPMIRRPAARQ